MKSKLPVGWREAQLGEIIELTMGQSPKSKYYNEIGEGMAFMQGNTTFGRKYPEIERYTTKVTRVANKGDILMSVRAPVGALNISNIEELCIGRGLCSIRMKNGMQEFIFFAMQYNMKILKSRESGTVFSSINKGDLESLPMKLPPINEQKAIADTLSSLDDKIELNNMINENLGQQAQAIFKHWFVDFEFPDKEGLPYKTSGGKMVESELGLIPEAWQVVKFGDIFEFVKGKVPTYVDLNHELAEPYLNKAALDGKWQEIKYGKYSTGIRCNELDILMMMDGSSSSEVFYGYSGLVGSTLSLIKTAEEDYRELLFLYFTIYNNQLKNQNTGSAIPHANKNYINNLKMALPNSKIVRRKFTSFFRQVREINLNKQYENERLSELRDTLLPKLMSGEIRIPLDKS